MIETSAAKLIEKAIFLNDEFCWLLTPKPLRSDRDRSIYWGHILGTLPPILLFLPLAISYVPTQGGFLSMLLLVFLGVEMFASLALVSYAKRKIKVIAGLLEQVAESQQLRNLVQTIIELWSPQKQVVLGCIASVSITLLAQASNTLRASDIWIRIIVSSGIAYAAFFVGAGAYLVFALLRTLNGVSAVKFSLAALFPYQSVELKQIADSSVTVSLVGAFVAAALTSMVFFFATAGGAGKSIYWGSLLVIVTVLSWVAVSVPFFISQAILAHIIKQSKGTTLSHLSIAIRRTFAEIEGTEKDPLERLEKLQSLYDQIYKSPNAIINVSILTKYGSSLLVTIIPSLVITYLQSLLK